MDHHFANIGRSIVATPETTRMRDAVPGDADPVVNLRLIGIGIAETCLRLFGGRCALGGSGGLGIDASIVGTAVAAQTLYGDLSREDAETALRHAAERAYPDDSEYDQSQRDAIEAAYNFLVAEPACH